MLAVKSNCFFPHLWPVEDRESDLLTISVWRDASRDLVVVNNQTRRCHARPLLSGVDSMCGIACQDHLRGKRRGTLSNFCPVRSMLELPLMALYDTVTTARPKPRPVNFRREKWIEHLCQRLLVHATSP